MTVNDPRRRRIVTAGIASATVLAVLAGIVALTWVSRGPTTTAKEPAAAATSLASPGAPLTEGLPEPARPATDGPDETASLKGVRNVVLIVADDLDTGLFNQVPRLAALRDKGMSFLNNTVTDSLCCPSRVSIFRGQLIHNHHVVSNVASSGGGWPTFQRLDEQQDCLPVWLHSAGVTTGMFGKYLNEYPDGGRGRRYVPPGWSSWVVPISHGETYDGYNYELNDNGAIQRYGHRPEDFLNDVITQKAVDFIERAPDGFFAELATYSPHKPAPVALRNRGTHMATAVPQTPDYNAIGTNEPTWLAGRPALTPRQLAGLDRMWRQRAQSAESVADSVAAVFSALEASGHVNDTLVIITADNGYHAGAHRLPKGKRTAYREDAVVPMVAIGPGITPGSSVSAMTTTIDLAPTIAHMLGTKAPAWVDGRSLVPILATGQAPEAWRTATLSESMGTSTPDDPDYQPWAPPQYAALRSTQWLFVTYQDGERELYDLVNDPYELDNVVGTTDPSVVADLYTQLQLMRSCSGDTCRTYDALPMPAAS